MSRMSEFALTHSHLDDPYTSKDAAQSIEDIAGKHMQVVLAVLESGPKSSEQIEQCCPLQYYQIMRRITDLRHKGKIEDSGERTTNRNGRKAIVWRLT